MKKILLWATTLLVLAGQNTIYAQTDYRGTINYRSGEMREVGDSLEVSFWVEVKDKAVRRGEVVRLRPRIVAQDNSLPMPELLVLGSNREHIYKRWERLRKKADCQRPRRVVGVAEGKDTVLHYEFSLPYQMWMDDANMVLYVENTYHANRSSMMSIAIADKVNMASLVPYTVHPRVNYILPDVEQKSRKKQGQAFLDFQAGRSEIIPSYRRNIEELDKIHKAFAEITDNPDVKVSGLFIEGYASPEGRYQTNERLSRERANSLMNYIVNNFNLPMSYSNIRASSIAEDWDGLRAAVIASDISRKEQILSIVDNTPYPDQREAKLRGLTGVWHTMLRDIFPMLRRVEYQIDFTVRDYSLNEAKNLVGKNDMLLSQRELFDVAMSYGEGTTEFERIMLDIIPRHYTGDNTAAINSAAAMIRRGETATAKRYLEKYVDSPAAMNNLGVISLIEGDLDRAQNYFTRALASGVIEAEQNLGEVNKKREDNERIAKRTK